MKMYSLFDKVGVVYFSPFCCANDAAACRSVATAVHMDNTIVSQHPKDFSLYLVGEFSEESGKVTAAVPTRFIKHVIELAPAVSPTSELPFDA